MVYFRVSNFCRYPSYDFFILIFCCKSLLLYLSMYLFYVFQILYYHTSSLFVNLIFIILIIIVLLFFEFFVSSINELVYNRFYSYTLLVYYNAYFMNSLLINYLFHFYYFLDIISQYLLFLNGLLFFRRPSHDIIILHLFCLYLVLFNC